MEKPRRLTGGEIVCEELLRHGVDVAFGIPGGAALPLYDAMTKYPALRHILVRHEQGAAHAADGYARMLRRPGVCLATSGPGATNLVTGIATANMDSVPMVAITSNVASYMLGKDAFQEVDITGITVPITRKNFLVHRAEDISETIAEAFQLTMQGRPKPVLVDVPKDVLQTEVDYVPAEIQRPSADQPFVEDGYHRELPKLADLIAQAHRPLILAGRGVIVADAAAELRELAEKVQIPVVNSLLGLGSFPESHPLSMGMAGMHGHAYTNLAIQEADLIVGIGTRFDDRICSNFAEFAPLAKIVHIDIQASQIGRNLRCDLGVVGDAREVLRALLPLVAPKRHGAWLHHVENLKRDHPTWFNEELNLPPQFVIKRIAELTPANRTVVTDVGQHQMWAAQHFGFEDLDSHISSGGLGTMGFALPAAMGVQVARPDRVVWAIAGDGGFMMTLQELATLVQDNIPVKIAIVNNRWLGMVRQWQQLFYEDRYSATYLSTPDFAMIARGFGVPSWQVDRQTEADDAIRAALTCPGPALIDFRVEAEENCYPMVASGRSLSEVVEAPRRVTVSA